MNLKRLFYISGLLLIGISLLFGVDEIRITTNPTADEVRIADQKVEVSTVSAVQFISSGTVGIGTPDPSSALDILNGSITVRGTNAGISIAGQPVSTVAANSFALDTSGSTQTKTGGLVLNGYMGLNGTASSRFDVIDGSITVRGTNAGMRLLGAIDFGSSPSTGTIFTYNNTTGLNFNPVGSHNTFLGEGVPSLGVNIGDNTGIGYQSMNALSTGFNNTAVGGSSLLAVNSGDANVAMGRLAGSGITTGDLNTAIGYAAGQSISVGSRNTFLGSGADSGGANNLTNAAAIGANASIIVSSGMVLGGLDGTANAVNVGIGTNAPSSRFDVIGGSITIRGGNAGLVIATSAFVVNTNAQIGIGTVGTSSLLDIVGGSVTIRGSNKGLIVGTTDFVVTNNGQVGIGTANPSSGFSMVGGSISVKGATAGLEINLQNNVGNPVSQFLSGGTGSHLSIGWGRAVMEGQLAVAAGNGQFSLDAVAGDIIFRTPNGSGEKLHILTGPNNSAIVIDSSERTGMGTASPSSKLDVVGGSITVRGTNAGLAIPGHGTTGSAANAYLDATTGALLRSTSSRRYKDRISTFTATFEDILNVTPKLFRDREMCKQAVYISSTSLNANEEAITSQIFDHWSYDEACNKMEIGFIAEEFDEQPGLRDLVVYNKAGQPDAIKYDRITIYLLEVIKDLKRRIEILEAP